VTTLSLVVAVADNGVIGCNGKLPWYLPDDLKHFKAVTLGKPVLMGRKTFESIGRALPGRRNLVLTRATDRSWAGVETVDTLQAARERVAAGDELCVIGGADLYAQALPVANRLYLTRVHATPAGDTHFPLQALEGWREIEREEHPADARHACAMSFISLTR
jgi:dihydrofolate reductase